MADTAASKKIFDGRYEILSIIGRGSCSVVYHARHVDSPHAEVALKVLLNRKEVLSRGLSLADSLRQEALALVSSRHRFVVRLDDFHSAGDLCYLSLEYAPLLDIRKFISSRGGKLPAVQVERFMSQSAEALAFLHKAGIIHRDLKPDNILVMNEREIRLADFGVAVLPGDLSDLEDLRRGVGTMAYMAPEVLDGTRYDERSDVYALGVTFYEASCGIHPFEDAPLAEQLSRRRDGNFSDIRALAPEISPALAAIIMRAMSYDADARFGSGRELHQALQDLRDTRVSPGSLTQSLTTPISGGATSSQELQAQPIDYASELPRSVQDLLDALERELPADSNGHADEASDIVPLHAKTDSSQELNLDDDFLDDYSDSAFEEEIPSLTPKQDPDLLTSDTVIANEEISSATAELSNDSEAATGSMSDKLDANPFGPGEHATFSEPHQEPSAPGDLVPETTSAPTPPLPVDPDPSTSSELSGASESAEKPEQSSDLSASTVQQQPVEQVISNGPAARTTLADTLARPPLTPPPPRRSASLALIALAIIPVLVILFFRLRGESGHTTDAVPNSIATFEGFPSYSGGALTFPALPTGTYEGSIHGLFPGLTVPLAIISNRELGQVTFILGLEGTRPVSIQLNDNIKAGPIRFASAGLMLSFDGEERDGELSGYVQEATTGVEAEWRARPRRHPAAQSSTEEGL